MRRRRSPVAAPWRFEQVRVAGRGVAHEEMYPYSPASSLAIAGLDDEPRIFLGAPGTPHISTRGGHQRSSACPSNGAVKPTTDSTISRATPAPPLDWSASQAASRTAGCESATATA